MALLTIQQHIAYLDEQKKRLQARLNKHDRARDTRRKFLFGALVLQRLEQSKAQVGQLDAWLGKELPGCFTRSRRKQRYAVRRPALTTLHRLELRLSD